MCLARGAGPPRSRGVLSRQDALVTHRAGHTERGVQPDMVVILDPGRGRGSVAS